MTVYTWSDVEFTNGTIVTENDLDQVMENVQYAREEMRWRSVGTVGAWAYERNFLVDLSFSTPEVRFELIANASTSLGTSSATASGSYTTLSVKNASLAALAVDQDHTLKVRIHVRQSGLASWITTGTLDFGPFSFVRTPDVDFASFILQTRVQKQVAIFEGLTNGLNAGPLLDQRCWFGVHGLSILVHRDSGEF